MSAFDRLCGLPGPLVGKRLDNEVLASVTNRRTSASAKFRWSVKTYFFNTIDPFRTFGRGITSALTDIKIAQEVTALRRSGKICPKPDEHLQDRYDAGKHEAGEGCIK